jgi:hypothetical protein
MDKRDVQLLFVIVQWDIVVFVVKRLTIAVKIIKNCIGDQVIKWNV